MNARAPFALALVAGLPVAASAQEHFIVNTTWVEVVAGSINPVPAPNSILEPGEAARIRVGVEAHINGASAIGQTTTYINPAPGGTGTVRGLGLVAYDLVGDGGAPSANGTWGGFLGGLAGPIPGAPFFSAQAGVPEPGGSSVIYFGGLQPYLPGSSINPINSNVQVFRGVWQPTSYMSRTVTFTPRGSIQAAGQYNSVILAYGLGTDPNTGENYDLLVGKFIGSSFGGVQVPIGIPSPSILTVLGLGALAANGRHRRNMQPNFWDPDRNSPPPGSAVCSSTSCGDSQ